MSERLRALSLRVFFTGSLLYGAVWLGTYVGSV